MGQLTTIALLALLILILVPLLAPVRIRVVFTPGGTRIRTRWMMQFVEYHLPERVQLFGIGKYVLFRRTLGPSRPPLEEPTIEPATARKRIGIGARTRAAWHYRPVLRRSLLVVLRLVGRLLRSFHFQEGRVMMTVGSGDPARTGMLTGMYYALQPALRRRFPRLHLSLTPDFNQLIMSVEGYFKWRLIPIEPVFHLMRALGTLPWRGLWKLRKAWSS